MKSITAHQTTDGQIFESFEEAFSYQALLDLRLSVNLVANNMYFPNMDASGIFDGLMENPDKLIEMGELAKKMKEAKISS